MKLRLVLMDAPGGSLIRGIPVYQHEWSDSRIGQLVAVPELEGDDPVTLVDVEDLRSERG